MADLWGAARRFWGLDSDPPLTDPESGNNLLVEATIIAFQEAAHAVTDKLAEVSAAKEENTVLLEEYRQAVTQAYVLVMDNNSVDAEKELGKVVGR